MMSGIFSVRFSRPCLRHSVRCVPHVPGLKTLGYYRSCFQHSRRQRVPGSSACPLAWPTLDSAGSRRAPHAISSDPQHGLLQGDETVTMATCRDDARSRRMAEVSGLPIASGRPPRPNREVCGPSGRAPTLNREGSCSSGPRPTHTCGRSTCDSPGSIQRPQKDSRYGLRPWLLGVLSRRRPPLSRLQ